jgi:hypothetical protein
MEYYIDSDPGLGNATPILGFASSPNIVDYNFNVDVSGYPSGIHTLIVRSRDTTGRWSITSVKQFESAPPLAVETFYFEATAQEKNAHLRWEVVSDVEIEKFKILRSKNGIDFDEIDEILASADQRYMQYVDLSLTTSRYYYRIHAYDINGLMTPSAIRVVDIIGGADYTILGNPSSQPQIISDKALDMAIFDMQGKRIRQMTVFPSQPYIIDELRGGTYLVGVVQGATFTQAKKFIIVPQP